MSDKLKSLQVKRTHADAITPFRASDFAAGYDISSCENASVPARGQAIIDTGFIFVIPKGHYGRLAPRSGLASRYSIDVGAGVIDADYRGTVKVLLFNHSDNVFNINKGDRIAQLILERISLPEVFEVDEIDDTVRGENGFGSTGIRKIKKK